MRFIKWSLTVILVILVLFIYSLVFPKSAGRNLVSGISLINSDAASGVIKNDEAFLQKFSYLFDRKKLRIKYKIQSDKPLNCATSIILDYKNSINKLNSSTIKVINSFLNLNESASIQTYISQSGKFQINYEKSGDNAVPLYDKNFNGVPDYVEDIADFCDYSYRLLVDTLGYLSPINENKLYRIEFQKMYAAAYTINDQYNPECTKIVLNSNLIEFGKMFGNQKDSLGTAKVTVAHELKHAVQYQYSNWRDKNWFLELDATWMEDIAYSDVNNYYNYLYTSQITDPDKSFADGMGYGNCIWMHFLTQSFGIQINKEIWEIASLKKDKSFSDSIQYDIFNEALQKYGTTFESAVTRYFVWNYFSGNNTTAQFQSFKESAFYPNPKLAVNVFEDSSTISGLIRQRISADFIKLKCVPNSSLEIKFNFENSMNNIAVIIKHSSGCIDIKYFDGISDPLNFSTDSTSKDIEEVVLIPVAIYSVNNNFNYTCSINYIPNSTDTDNESTATSIDNHNGIQNKFELVQNYPNPFNPNTKIRFALPFESNVKVDIYNILGEQVKELVSSTLSAGNYEMNWDASNVASGMYILQINASSTDGQNKFLKIRKMLLIK